MASGYFGDPFAPLTPTETSPQDYSGLTVDQLVNDPRVLNDIYDFYRERDGKEFNNHEEAVDYFLADRAWANYNVAGGDLWGKSSTLGEVYDAYTESPKQRDIHARLQSAYESLPDFYEKGGAGWGHFTSNLLPAAVFDLTNLIGGIGGKVAGKAAVKAAQHQAMKKVSKELGYEALRGKAMRAGLVKGGLSEAAVNTGIEGVADAALQGRDIELGIQDEFSPGRAALAGAAGGVLGGVMGGAFGAVGGGSRAAFREGTDEAAEQIVSDFASIRGRTTDPAVARAEAEAAQAAEDAKIIKTEPEFVDAISRYIEELQQESASYTGPNLKVSDPDALASVSQRMAFAQRMLDWPKERSVLQEQVTTLKEGGDFAGAQKVQATINEKEALWDQVLSSVNEPEDLDDAVDFYGREFERADAANENGSTPQAQEAGTQAAAAEGEVAGETAPKAEEVAPEPAWADDQVELGDEGLALDDEWASSLGVKAEEVQAEAPAPEAAPPAPSAPIGSKRAAAKHLSQFGYNPSVIESELTHIFAGIKGRGAKATRQVRLDEFILEKEAEAKAGAMINDAIAQLGDDVFDDDVLSAFVDAHPYMGEYKERIFRAKDKFLTDNADMLISQVMAEVGPTKNKTDYIDAVFARYGSDTGKRMFRAALERSKQAEGGAVQEMALGEPKAKGDWTGISKAKQEEIRGTLRQWDETYQKNHPEWTDATRNRQLRIMRDSMIERELAKSERSSKRGNWTGITQDAREEINGELTKWRRIVNSLYPDATDDFIEQQVRARRDELIEMARQDMPLPRTPEGGVTPDGTFRDQAITNPYTEGATFVTDADGNVISDELGPQVVQGGIITGRRVERDIDLNTQILKNKVQGVMRRGKEVIKRNPDGTPVLNEKGMPVVEYTIIGGDPRVSSKAASRLDSEAISRTARRDAEQDRVIDADEWLAARKAGEEYKPKPSVVKVDDSMVDATELYQVRVGDLEYPPYIERPLPPKGADKGKLTKQAKKLRAEGKVKEAEAIEHRIKDVAFAQEVEKFVKPTSKQFSEDGHDITVSVGSESGGARLVTRGEKRYLQIPTEFSTADGFKPGVNDVVWVDPQTGLTYYNKRFRGFTPEEARSQLADEAAEMAASRKARAAAANLRKTGDKATARAEMETAVSERLKAAAEREAAGQPKTKISTKDIQESMSTKPEGVRNQPRVFVHRGVEVDVANDITFHSTSDEKVLQVKLLGEPVAKVWKTSDTNVKLEVPTPDGTSKTADFSSTSDLRTALPRELEEQILRAAQDGKLTKAADGVGSHEIPWTTSNKYGKGAEAAPEVRADTPAPEATGNLTSSYADGTSTPEGMVLALRNTNPNSKAYGEVRIPGRNRYAKGGDLSPEVLVGKSNPADWEEGYVPRGTFSKSDAKKVFKKRGADPAEAARARPAKVEALANIRVPASLVPQGASRKYETVKDVWNTILELETLKWPSSPQKMQDRVTALKALYGIMERLVPNGVEMPNANRRYAMHRIMGIFDGQDTATITAARDFLRRLGGDKRVGPRFADDDGMGYNPNTNVVSVDAKALPDNIPSLVGLYHEVAHWAYMNLLTPAERSEFWNAIDKYVGPEGADFNKIKSKLPYSGGNAMSSPGEFFANQFVNWIISEGKYPVGTSLWGRILHKVEGIFAKFFDNGTVDEDLIPLFQRILPDDPVTQLRLLPESKYQPKTDAGEVLSKIMWKFDMYRMDLEQALNTGNISTIEHTLFEFAKAIKQIRNLKIATRRGAQGTWYQLKDVVNDIESTLTNAIGEDERWIDIADLGDDFDSDAESVRSLFAGSSDEAEFAQNRAALPTEGTINTEHTLRLYDIANRLLYGNDTPQINPRTGKNNRTFGGIYELQRRLGQKWQHFEKTPILVDEDTWLRRSNHSSFWRMVNSKRGRAAKQARRDERAAQRVAESKTSQKRPTSPKAPKKPVDQAGATSPKSMGLRDLISEYRAVGANSKRGRDLLTEVERKLAAKLVVDPTTLKADRLMEVAAIRTKKEARSVLAQALEKGDRDLTTALNYIYNKRWGEAPQVPTQRMVIDAVQREIADNTGVSIHDGIPASARADTQELLSRMTHRNPKAQANMRTMAYRMLNLLGRTTRDELGEAQLLSVEDIYRLAGKQAPATARGAFVDTSDPAFSSLRNDMRRIAIGLTSGKSTPMDMMHEVGHLAERLLPPEDQASISEMYRAARDGGDNLAIEITSRRKGLDEDTLAREWFAEGWAEYLAERVAKGDMLNARLGGAGAEASLELRNTMSRLVDTVTEYVAYLLNGLIGRNDIKQMYRRLTFYGDMFAPKVKSAVVDQGEGISPLTASAYSQKIMSTMDASRVARIKDFVNLREGENLIDYLYYHGTPFGNVFDRSSNPNAVLRPSGANGLRGPGVYLASARSLAEGYSKTGSRKSLHAAIKNTITDTEDYMLAIDLADRLWEEGGVTDQIAYHWREVKRLEAQAKGGRVNDGRRGDLDELFGFDVAERLDYHEKALREAIEQEKNIHAMLGDLDPRLGYEPKVLPLFVRAQSGFDFRAGTQYSLLPEEGVEDVAPLLEDLIDSGVASEDGVMAMLAQLGDEGFDGDQLYDGLIHFAIAEDMTDESLNLARAKLTDFLRERGYDSIHISEPGRDGKFTDALVVFDSSQVKHPKADMFDVESPGIYQSADMSRPRFVGEIIENALADDGTFSPRSSMRLALGVEKNGLGGHAQRLMKRLLRQEVPDEQDMETVYKFSMPVQLRDNARRIQRAGAHWIADFIAKQHTGTGRIKALGNRSGVGFYEDHAQQLSETLMPLLEMMRELPDATSAIKRWARKSNPFGEVMQPESHKRIVSALRRGDPRMVNPEERPVFEALQTMFDEELKSLRKAGLYVGEIKNYFPQIWDEGAVLDKLPEFQEDLARFFYDESRVAQPAGAERTPISMEEARTRAQRVANQIVEEDGVVLPHKGGRRGVVGDHLDYSRMIRLGGEHLNVMEKYMVNDLEGIVTKYLDSSSRKRMFAEKYGVQDHGWHAYKSVIAGGRAAIAQLLSSGKIYTVHRHVVVEDHVSNMGIENTLFPPLTKSPAEAAEYADTVATLIETADNKALGIDRAKNFLVNLHKKKFGDNPEWAKRVDGIVNAVADFGANGRGMSAQEFAFMEEMFNTMQRKPVHTSSGYRRAMKASRLMRSFNSISLLGYTTLTSIPDVALPLIRSGNFGATFKAWNKYMSDPDYRRAARNIGVSIENVLHDRLANMYGTGGGRFTNSFFNATFLTGWTNTMRDVAGLVAYESFRTEAMRAQRLAAAGKRETRSFRRAKRYLTHFGLEEYLEPGKPIDSLDAFMKDPKLRMGAVKFANETVFAPNQNEMPLWTQTPWGSLVWQLKSFPTMMGRMSKYVMDEAQHGNMRPLMALAAVAPATGAVSLGIKDVLQMRGGEDQKSMAPRERLASEGLKQFPLLEDLANEIGKNKATDKMVGWYLEGLMQAGGLGMIAELIYNSAAQVDNGVWGQMRMLSYIGGPSVGAAQQALEIVAGVTDANEGSNAKERSAARSFAARLPMLGGNRAFRENFTDAVAGEESSGGGSATGGFSGGGFGGGGFSGGGFK